MGTQSTSRGTARALSLAARLTLANAARLAWIAVLVAVPIATIVLAIELVAWQQLDPGRPGVEPRQLGDAVRTVDVQRMSALAVLRYALGAAAYLLIAYRALALLAPAARVSGAPRLSLGSAAFAALVALAIAVVVRLAISVAAAELLAPLADDDGVVAYLVAINSVHAAGKVLTAPFLAAVVAVLVAGRRRAQPARA